MQTIKAIFFDVDSTLYTHRVHDFPQSAKDALQELKKNGYKVGIATSRCRYETKNLPQFFRAFDFDASIYDGGALVMAKDQIIQKHPIRKQQIKDLLVYTKQHNIPMRYSTFDGNYVSEECSWQTKDKFFKLYLNMPQVKVYENEDVYNILVYPTNDEQVADIHRQLHDASIVVHSQSTLEITAQGIDKSVGVRMMADVWGITPDQIVCFGDGANDVGMLQYAGVGIAMGNGNQKAKDASNRICKHIDEDGIYHMCKELKLI